MVSCFPKSHRCVLVFTGFLVFLRTQDAINELIKKHPEEVKTLVKYLEREGSGAIWDKFPKKRPATESDSPNQRKKARQEELPKDPEPEESPEDEPEEDSDDELNCNGCGGDYRRGNLVECNKCCSRFCEGCVEQGYYDDKVFLCVDCADD